MLIFSFHTKPCYTMFASRRRAFASSNFRRASGRGRRRVPRCFDALRAPAYFLSALGPVLGFSAANGCSPFQQLDNLGSIAGVFDLAGQKRARKERVEQHWLVGIVDVAMLPEPGCSPWRSRCIMLLKKVFRSWHCGLHMIAPQLQHQSRKKSFWWLLISTWSFELCI